MHILLIHQAFVALDEAGGTRHIEMARLLAAKGHQITIITGTTSYLTGVKRSQKRHGLERTELEPGITLIHAWSYAALHRSFLQRLLSFFSFMASSFLAGLGVRKIDLVWGTSPPIFQAFTAWLLAFLKQAPFLFEVRDLWPEFAVAMGVIKNPLVIALSSWLERFLYRRARRVVVNSPGYIEHVRNRGASQVDLVPNGVDPGMFDPSEDGAKWRSKLGLMDRFVVVYAGAHGPANHLWSLLDAAAELQEKAPVHFLLVGDGKDKPALQTAAKQKHLQNLTFLPPVSKREIKAIFGAADACVAILKPLDAYKTTYPNKVFDYMAAGRPVVLAIDGVIREVVECADAGIFADAANPAAIASAVHHLYENPQLCKQMGANGRQHVLNHYTRQTFTEIFEKILLNLNKKN